MHKRHCPSPSSLRNCEQIPPSLRQNSCLGQQAYRRCYGPRLRAFSPQIFQELLGVPHRWVVFDRCNPSGAAADAGHDAAARVLGAARAAEDGVVDVPQALHGSPSAPPIHAQRVARFDHYRARNCLPPQKLRREIQ